MFPTQTPLSLCKKSVKLGRFESVTEHLDEVQQAAPLIPLTSMCDALTVSNSDTAQTFRCQVGSVLWLCDAVGWNVLGGS